MKAFLTCLLAFVFLLGACAPAAPAGLPTGTPEPAAAPTIPAPVETLLPFSMIRIPAPSLEGNLLGDRAERNLYVYLPPSYNTSEQRYPVVYFLPGYTTTIMPGVQLPGDFDALIESGKVQEMIVVVASGVNKLGGGMYVNSPAMGNWEDFIVKDVVGYVDSHFRTLPQAESRGIGGHSMGGFGSLNIATRHPEVFGAVYSLSPALYDETALERSLFANDFANRAFLNFQADLAELSPEKAASRLPSAPNQFTLAYGLAFAPMSAPPYFEYPYKEVDGELVRDDAIWAKWQSGFGGIAEETVQYKDNLLQLKGIVVDYGTADEFTWIPTSCEYYGEQLTAAGIQVKVVHYNGDHNNQIGNRIREYLLPFFSEMLVSE